MAPKPGELAPDFSLPADDGSTFTLSEHRGETVVLYFYPKDMTSGCTTQAEEFTALHDAFREKGAIVVGVSRDGPERHRRFREKVGIPYPLLSDPDHRVHELYGAWGEKRSFGKLVQGVLRTTVVIDPEGRVKHIAHKVRARGNPARTLKLLEA